MLFLFSLTQIEYSKTMPDLPAGAHIKLILQDKKFIGGLRTL